MDTVFAFLKYAVLGFFGLIALLFLLAVVFGKRVLKQWEYEAKFRDTDGREFGEFDIELSRIAKEETEDTFKASFKMRHASLAVGEPVQVFLESVLVLEGDVDAEGRIYLAEKHLKTPLSSASSGEICKVIIGGFERFSEPIIPD